jgi:hypothetical protein
VAEAASCFFRNWALRLRSFLVRGSDAVSTARKMDGNFHSLIFFCRPALVSFWFDFYCWFFAFDGD